MNKLSVSGLNVEVITFPISKTQFDLTLNIADTEGFFELDIDYNTDLFTSSTIDLFTERFMTLLTNIASNPLQQIRNINMLSEEELRRILYEWNDTYNNYGQSHSLSEVFETQAEQSTKAVAVIDGELNLTYDELNRRANQLARYLLTIGAGPEVRVGICAERSLNLIIGILGILKAGSAYVPLDPGYPMERLSFMLKDSDLSIILTDQKSSRIFNTEDIKTFCLDYLEVDLGRFSSENLRNRADPENLAYVIYTSGSTGNPKGVMVTHSAILNTIRWLQQTFELT